MSEYDEYNDDRRDDRTGRKGRQGGRGRGVPLSELDPALTETSHTVIGCARDVHVELGPGYPKTVYVEAMKRELEEAGVAFRTDALFEVPFKSTTVGSVTADFFVANRFLLEIGDAPGPVGSFERSSLRAKLRAADLELGLIINFSGRLLKDGLVRVLNPDKLKRESAPDEHMGETHYA